MLARLYEAIRSYFIDEAEASDRRRHHRFSCSLRTGLGAHDLSGRRHKLPGSIMNISVSGCLFVPDAPPGFEWEELADASIQILGQDIPLEVVRLTHSGIHCRFQSLVDEALVRRVAASAEASA